MKKKTIMMGLLCSCLLTVGSIPGVVTAQESTEEETETAQADEEDVEAESETEEKTEEPRPEYDALDYVELGDYIGLTVQVTPIEITDDEVMEEADTRIRDTADVLESVDTVEEGDIVNIDYVGKIDGEEFDGGSDEGYELTIGSDTFIEGFEEGLIGASAGDTVELELTFPEYYYEDLAGEDVVFTVTVNEIYRVPELTDDVVDAVTDGEYTDVDSWLDYLRALLELDAAYYWEYQVQIGLMDALEENSVITEYPQDLYDYTVDQMIDYYTEDLLVYYYGDDYMDYIQGAVEESLEEELILMAVAETEGIELTDEEYETALEEYAMYAGYGSAELLEEDAGRDNLYNSFLESKVFSFLEENADIEESAAEDMDEYEFELGVDEEESETE